VIDYLGFFLCQKTGLPADAHEIFDPRFAGHVIGWFAPEPRDNFLVRLRRANGTLQRADRIRLQGASLDERPAFALPVLVAGLPIKARIVG